MQKAAFVHLKTNLWASDGMQHSFVALDATLTYSALRRELLAIGMDNIESLHTAKHIKLLILSIINNFVFDNSKIISLNSDEGKNLLRSFRQRGLIENRN
jgi:hypothetical protein